MDSIKVTVASDIHLEFDPKLELPGGELLLLAGDIITVHGFDKQLPWLEKTCARYDRTIMTNGNHTYYGGDLRTATRKVMEATKHIPNLFYGARGKVKFRGATIIFATLWTDFNGGDEETMRVGGYYMNDYRKIRCGGKRLTPDDILHVHRKHLAFIKVTLEACRREKVIVMSHHSPSRKSIHPRFDDKLINGCYSNNLDSLIEANPNIALWVHGHTHDSYDYMIGDTRIVCNPYGYYGYDMNPFFRKDLVIEV